MKNIVDSLRKNNKCISFMESCTGGALSNAITNIEGSSEVFKYSAITYSNTFKIKMGVSNDVIDKYSVYSLEVAKEMSKCISLFSDSDYGVGVTGKLNKEDKNNLYGDNNTVCISIYDKELDKFITDEVIVSFSDRDKNKKIIIDRFIIIMSEYLGVSCKR